MARREPCEARVSHPLGCFVFSAAPALGSEPQLRVHGLPDGLRHETPVDWIEVSGYAWTGESPYLDVVIVIDLSLSTLLASGVDVDGDGRVGWTHPLAVGFQRGPRGGANTYLPKLMSMDPDDSVMRAELMAARHFIDRVDFERTRVGLVTFAKRAALRSPLVESAAPLHDAIDRIIAGERQRLRTTALGAGSNTPRALAVAAGELLRARSASAIPRRGEVLLLSDGMPTRPKPQPERRLVAIAMTLQDHGIGTHFFPLGPLAELNQAFFEFVDEHAGARHTMVSRSGDIVEKLPQVRLDRIRALRVENRSMAEEGRALRFFADGSFDAVVPLRAGENEIGFRVTTEGGASAEVVRSVLHAPAPADDAEAAYRQRLALDAFARRMAERRAETELVVELEAARERALERERSIRVDVESD